jgi:Spy/CpxP family protein refolding chaperone
LNRIRLLSVSTIFLVVLGAAAQQTAKVPDNVNKDKRGQHGNMSNPEEHLRMLSEKLNLTAEQQEKARPIIQNMLDSRQKLMRDQTLSNEQREEKERALHEKASHELRQILNEEQKKQLDELEAQHHAESTAHAHH